MEALKQELKEKIITTLNLEDIAVAPNLALAFQTEDTERSREPVRRHDALGCEGDFAETSGKTDRHCHGVKTISGLGRDRHAIACHIPAADPGLHILVISADNTAGQLRLVQVLRRQHSACHNTAAGPRRPRSASSSSVR